MSGTNDLGKSITEIVDKAVREGIVAGYEQAMDLAEGCADIYEESGYEGSASVLRRFHKQAADLLTTMKNRWEKKDAQ